MSDTSHQLPPDSPADPAWTGPASTKSQASKHGVIHMSYNDAGQIDASLPDMAAGHYERTYPLEDQTDTAGIEAHDFPTDNFKRTTLLEEKLAGGYTPNTAPVGQGMPAPTITGSSRNMGDVEATRRLQAERDMQAAMTAAIAAAEVERDRQRP